MNKDTFDKLLDVSLKHVGNAGKEAQKYKLLFEEMSYYFMRCSEGDDVIEEAFALMREHGLIDEDDEWIYKDADGE
jgi:triphosphoribosyl-dephospho-CoA synthetase